MYRLDKFILHNVRYLVWLGSAAEMPVGEGVALLLSGKEGVGADRLVVTAPGHPWGIRCFGANGEACAVDVSARYVAALATERVGDGAGYAIAGAGAPLEYSEVRLTEAFFHRLMKHGCTANIAG